MAGRGRPPKYETLNQLREAQRISSNNYYKNNRFAVLERAKNRRKNKKEELKNEKE